MQYSKDRQIQKIQKVLELEGRSDIAELLHASTGKIDENGTYGSLLFSVLSIFEIYSPIVENHKLRKLNEAEHGVLLNSILEIYPKRSNAPEITGIEFLVEMTETETHDEIKSIILDSKSDKGLKVFLSHSHKDRKIAAMFKNKLEAYGFSVFVAHEDIHPSREWEEEILRFLKQTDIFIPILTASFHESYWCHQESGIAAYNKNLVVPVRINQTPRGFIGRFQAANLRGDNFDEIIQIVIRCVEDDPLLKRYLLETHIKAFSNSCSFDNARTNLVRLTKYDHFGKDQIRAILKASYTNNQIYNANSYSPFIGEKLKVIIEKNIKNVSDVDIQLFESKFGPLKKSSN